MTLFSFSLKKLHILLIAILFIALTGCASLQVKLGWKVYLNRTPIKTIEAGLPQGPGVAPGQKSPLVVTIVQPDGKTLLTEGKGGGKVMWNEVQVTASVVSVTRKGIVSLAKDPRVSDGKTGHIIVTVPSHPDMKTELDIPFRHNIAFAANFSGSKGADGMNGADGTDGFSGSTGSLDPNNPSAGGDGGNGGDGSNGEDGSAGGDARSVQVQVALQSGGPRLLEVSVSASGKTKFYLIDPNGGSLTVHADGGTGGSGGRGGRGGHGGSGGLGSPSGSNGRDGMDGRSGSDGSLGHGGLITVNYDPSAKPYLNAIHLTSKNGPSPLFREQAVAALW